MDNMTLIGGAVIALTSIGGLFKMGYSFMKNIDDTIAKSSQETKRATEENTKQLILFNNNLKHMREADDKRDEQIDSLVIGYDDHETRITVLEKTKFVKEYE